MSKKNIFPFGIYTYIRTFVVEQEFLNLVMDVVGNVGGNGCLFPKKFNLHKNNFKFIIEGWKAYLSKINDINEKHFLALHI